MHLVVKHLIIPQSSYWRNRVATALLASMTGLCVLALSCDACRMVAQCDTQARAYARDTHTQALRATHSHMHTHARAGLHRTAPRHTARAHTCMQA
eukprot:7237860-Alexandrium_andersonii.AAC.1